jgi:hypothetical protein
MRLSSSVRELQRLLLRVLAVRADDLDGPDDPAPAEVDVGQVAGEHAAHREFDLLPTRLVSDQGLEGRVAGELEAGHRVLEPFVVVQPRVEVLRRVDGALEHLDQRAEPEHALRVR